jgi:hypothetical protein
VHAFGDSAEHTHEPLEQRIARELWRWQSLPESEQSTITSARSDLSGQIEFYLCHALSLRPTTQTRGWWCDGALELSISQMAPTSFMITGAAIWAQGSSSFYIAPFEMEFYFLSPGELDPERIIVRFGVAEPPENIRRVAYGRFATPIVQRRPTRNQDWALAIEIS